LDLSFKTKISYSFYISKLQNHKIKVAQSDGGELCPSTKFLNDQGITPHTHHKNGPVERMHRHIVETGWTLLPRAKMLVFLGSCFSYSNLSDK
jgi:hypothetical protein